MTEFVQCYILENRPCFDVDDEKHNVVAFPSGPRNFLGFYRGDYIYVLPAALNKAITSAGFNYGSAMDLLVREGILERDKKHVAKTVRYNGNRVRMLQFNAKALFPEEDLGDKAEVTNTQLSLDEERLEKNA